MRDKIILYSGEDTAGVNISSKLRENHDVTKLLEVSDVLSLEKLKIDPQTLCIVASKHASSSGKPCLTTHSPGNYDTSDYGGNPRQLSFAPALYLQKALQLLDKKQKIKKIGYEVSLEATHHGPTALHNPIMFVEVGSSLKQWNDMSACSIAAETISELMNYSPGKKAKTAIGLGGGHYCRKFSRIKEYAIGHICPKHNLAYLDEYMLDEMITKTVPKPDTVYVEWKGLGKEKKRILGLIEETDLEVERI
ncbi:MAG: hypothetical protein B6U97_00125 [Candidatus Altiarchaeales archaeon ex4484_96]|nr:MAG: hypothetical protein B6U97_00125 [Candidatus Altiarchaeales archaeon ex4484_96]